MADIIEEYRGYELCLFELLDDEGFYKNCYEIQKDGDIVQYIPGYTYSDIEYQWENNKLVEGLTVSEKFRMMVDVLLD